MKRYSNKPGIVFKEMRTGGTDSMLSALWRKIIFDLGIDGPRFLKYIQNYIENAKLPYNLKDVSSVRGNIKKELESERMTWKVFIKGLLLINIEAVTLQVTLKHKSGRITQHERSIKLDFGEDGKDESDKDI